MIGRLKLYIWRWWSRLRARVTAARKERAIRAIARATDVVEWDEYEIRVDAACYADEFLTAMGLATGNQKADEKAAWELAGRLSRLHVESQRRKGARAP